MTIYFTELKYRQSNNQSGGLAAITTKKQLQMKFAAEYYMVIKKLKDVTFRLVTISMTNQPPEATTCLELE